MDHPKIILFEVNELPYRVVDDYVRKRPTSHLAELLRRGKQFETVCEDQIELDPWISWPTLHRGVIDEQHEILHLGQSIEEANRRYPPVWELLARAGVRVGIMGSLHTSTPPADLSNYAFYVPDFFADSRFAHPKQLEAFQAFNLAMTRRSARNVDAGVPLEEAGRFLLSYVRRGLSLSTVRRALAALVAERRRPELKCRRRAIQPLITLDLFLHLMRTGQPSFATLHTNHVAAAMHRYWAAGYPTDLPTNPMPADWRKKYEGEIDYSMDVLDVMLGRLKAFIHEHSEYKLLIASSLGQAAVQATQTDGFVTIMDLPKFMNALGVDSSQWKQRFAMVPCTSMLVDSSCSDHFEQQLLRLSVDGRQMVASKNEIAPLSFQRHGDSFHIFSYFQSYRGSWTARLGDRELGFEQLGLGFHAHQDQVACSARHTPNGILLVYDPKRPSVDHGRALISTLDIAPALIDAFAEVPPEYMHVPDAAVLDPSVVGTRIRVLARGGGVEKPVIRDAPSQARTNGEAVSVASP